jgi:hypothetical protein
MAVTMNWYGNGLLGLLSATAGRRVDWVGATVKLALTTSTYTPDQDAHDFFNDVTNEITGTGYTAGGVALTNKALTYDTATNEVRLKSDPAVWTNATFTARRGVLYVALGGASSADPLLGWCDFGADQSPAGINFQVTPDATSGWLKITAA